MLDKIREGAHGTAAKIVLFIIIAFFVLSGISSYLGSSGSKVVAEIAGHDVTQPEFDRQLYLNRMQLSPQMQAMPNIDKYLQERTLNELINQQLIALQADGLNFYVSDDQIRDAIKKDPNFQIDGKFSKDLYKSSFKNLGYASESQFLVDKRKELQMMQLVQGIGFSAFALDNEITQNYKLAEQTRGFEYLQIDSTLFDEAVSIDDAQLASYFELHAAEFETDEQVSVNYVELTLDDVKKSVTVDDAELLNYYDEHQDEFSQAAARHVAHILLTFPMNASDEQKTAVLEQAKQLRQQLVDGTEFAQIAKSQSQDKSSADKGGDLGWIEQDGGRDPAFEQAIFALEGSNAISEPVQSQFGYHIIKLLEQREKGIKSFDLVKAQIKDTLVARKAKDIFLEKRSQLSDLVYEDDVSLDNASDVLNLKIQTTDLFTRNSGAGIVNNAAVRAAAFSDQVMQDGRNSALLEISESHVVALHLKDHVASRIPDLAEVKEQVFTRVKAEKLKEQTKLFADELIKQLNSNSDVTELLSSKNLVWKKVEKSASQNSEVPADVLHQAFELRKPVNFPLYNLAESSNGVSIVKLLAIDDADPAVLTDELKAQLENSLTSKHASDMLSGVLDGLKELHPVKVNLSAN